MGIIYKNTCPETLALRGFISFTCLYKLLGFYRERKRSLPISFPRPQVKPYPCLALQPLYPLLNAQLMSHINAMAFPILCYVCFWESFHEQLLLLLTNDNKYCQELLKA